jgi:putative ABC transport system substrate-binding protein
VVYRIGFLTGRLASSSADPHRVAFRQRLRELGYVEGENVVTEYRAAEGKSGRLPDLAAELVGLKVDVIVTGAGPPVVRAAKQATHTIPIVMGGVHVDPVKAGFVVSLARPGGNITGMTNLESDLHPKRLELLKEAFPRISRVAILLPAFQQKQGMKDLEAAAQGLGIQIQSLIVTSRRPGSLEKGLSTISRERPDGLLVATSGFTIRHTARIIEFTAKRRMPTMYARSEFTAKRRMPTMYARSGFVNEGGLMSYGTDSVDIHRRVANFVGKILKRTKPADLPVERPRKFELIINLKTAKKLGLTIPPSILYRADKVIK